MQVIGGASVRTEEDSQSTEETSTQVSRQESQAVQQRSS